MSKFTAYSATNTGYVRSINQDKALAADYLLAVADGMGGHAGGEVAAKIAIEALDEGFQEDNSTNGLLKAIRNANKTIMNRSLQDQTLKGMGTTLVAAALVVDQDILSHIIIVNIGDSRAYLLPTNGQLSRLTEDHSLVEELVRRGEITEAQALVHPHRHILTRALGIDENVEIDAWELELDGPARVLLCSDGLTNECSEAEIGQLLRQYKNPKQAADKLVELALAHGGNDNVTVVVADIPPELFDRHTNKDDERVQATADGQLRKNSTENSNPVFSENSIPNEADKNLFRMKTETPNNKDITVALQKEELTEKNNTSAIGKDNFIQVDDDALSKKVHTETNSTESTITKATGNKSVKTVVSLNSSVTSRIKQNNTTASPKSKRSIDSGRNFSRSTKKENSQLDLPSTPLTFRVVVFVILFVSIFGGAASVVYWYLHSSYYVGIDNNHVAIFQGRPGGFLAWKPTLYEETNLAVTKVFSPEVPELKKGMIEPSLGKAEAVVRDLGNAQSYLQLPAGNSAPAAETFFVPLGATPIFTKPGVGPTIPTTTIPTIVPSPVTTTARLICVIGTSPWMSEDIFGNSFLHIENLYPCEPRRVLYG